MSEGKRVLWVVEIRNPTTGIINIGLRNWTPCSYTFLSREAAREEARSDWGSQGFETRVVKYTPGEEG